MSLDTLRAKLPAYAKDLDLNLAALARETELSEAQMWGCLIACAYAVGVGPVIAELEDGCPLSPALADAAKAAAAIMNMNNVYYRAVHLMKSREYTTLPAHLRMGILSNTGAPKADFELWCVAVSAINGCGACLDSHEAVLRTHGAPAPLVQAALRIAAIVNAVSRVLAAEDAVKAARGRADKS